DECYWVQNEPRMRGKKEFDPNTDTPPDLAVEVDITRSSLDRMAIYAALGIPEVWRFDGESFSIHQLGSGGKYKRCDRSPTFPHLPLAEVERFLGDSDTQDETTLLRSFSLWVRTHLLPAFEAAAAKPRKGARKESKGSGK